MEPSEDASHGLLAILLLIKVKVGLKLVFRYPLDLGQTGASDDNLLFGHRSEALEGLLAAQPWSDGTRLEVTFGDLSFLSHPSFARKDGSWADSSSTGRSEDLRTGAAPAIEPRGISQHAAVTEHDFAHAPASFNSQLSSPGASTSLDSVSTKGSDTDTQGMEMFQVIFVTSRHANSAMLYDQIVKPLSVALQHLQQQNHWVEQECRALLRARSRVRAARHQQSPGLDPILQTNELAWALKEVYEAVKHKSVATIRLSGIHMTMLVPADEKTVDQGLDRPDTETARLAVMLLEDKSRLLHELDDRPGSAALAFFITHVVPTKPLSKIAVRLSLPINAVIFLARHLVKWRKARLIPPLHARNSYVVDPAAPLDKLNDLWIEYAKRFPALLSLESMLKIIGSPEPIVYGTCFPSRVHRDTYMDILAWLVRQRLVTRLRTIGWLRITSLSSKQDQYSGLDTDEYRIDERSLSHEDEDDESLPSHSPLIINATDLDQRQHQFVQSLCDLLRQQGLDGILRKMLPYLDGEHSLEDIAVYEGLRRTSVEDCLSVLHDLGALKTVQCL